MRKDYPVFSSPSRRFFRYIAKLGLQTQEFLEDFPRDYAATTVPTIQLSKRQKLKTLHEAWYSLHEYIQPALDADSLNLPTPLIAALEDMLYAIKPWRRFSFVLFHTNEANYLEVPPELAKYVANNVALEVKGKEFPDFLGLVGVPYSQTGGFSSTVCYLMSSVILFTKRCHLKPWLRRSMHS